MKQASAGRFLFFSILFVTNVTLFAQEAPVKVFPFKSAVITYKYEASFRGTHVKYIDDYGFKQADYIKKQENFGGNSGKELKTVILIGDRAYTIDRKSSTFSWFNREARDSYLKRVKTLTYNKSTLLADFNVFVTESRSTQISFDENTGNVHIGNVFGSLSADRNDGRVSVNNTTTGAYFRWHYNSGKNTVALDFNGPPQVLTPAELTSGKMALRNNAMEYRFVKPKTAE